MVIPPSNCPKSTTSLSACDAAARRPGAEWASGYGEPRRECHRNQTRKAYRRPEHHHPPNRSSHQLWTMTGYRDHRLIECATLIQDAGRPQVAPQLMTRRVRESSANASTHLRRSHRTEVRSREVAGRPELIGDDRLNRYSTA